MASDCSVLSILQVGIRCPESVLSCSYFSRTCGKSYNNKRSSGTQISVSDSRILQPSFKDWMKGEELERGHQDWTQFQAMTGVGGAHDNYVDVARDRMNDTGWGALPQLWPSGCLSGYYLNRPPWIFEFVLPPGKWGYLALDIPAFPL